MTVLSQITSPVDLKKLPVATLGTLAQEIREFMIAGISGSGGHLGSNLGVVELTIAVHRVFNGTVALAKSPQASPSIAPRSDGKR
jgi:1-deoxy-D-xylulose-5-phosphate synthase